MPIDALMVSQLHGKSETKNTMYEERFTFIISSHHEMMRFSSLLPQRGKKKYAMPCKKVFAINDPRKFFASAVRDGKGSTRLGKVILAALARPKHADRGNGGVAERERRAQQIVTCRYLS